MRWWHWPGAIMGLALLAGIIYVCVELRSCTVTSIGGVP
jgi:hypothetical protein